MSKTKDERVYITPNGFPGIYRKGDDQIAKNLEKTYNADLEKVGFDKAHKRLIERIGRIIQSENN